MTIENQFLSILETIKNNELVSLFLDGYLTCLGKMENTGIQENISSLDQGFEGKAVLLVSNIKMLKQYNPRLHPRIETLLVYHNRPVNLFCNQTINLPNRIRKSSQGYLFRIVENKVMKEIIERIGSPLYAFVFQDENGLPVAVNMNMVKKNLRSLDINQINSRAKYVDEPLLTIGNDEEGMLYFY